MPRKVDKEKKKAEILFAALKVFARKGFYKTKIEDIARELGIGKGTIYEYFRTKEELLGRGFELLFQEMDLTIDKLCRQPLPPVKKLEILIDFSIEEFVRFGEGLTNVLMDFWAEGIRSNHPDIVGSIDLKKIYRSYREKIARIIREGIKKGEFRPCHPEHESSILIASLDGLMLQWIMDPELFTLRKMRNFLKKHFLNSLKK